MKYFIILAVVIGSALGNGYFEPEDGVDDKCLWCGDPTGSTYAGTWLMLTTPSKFLMTQWHYDQDDNCKFEVDCVTASSFIVDGLSEPLWIDWCGVGIWGHKNHDKFFRNWVLGQDLNCIGERGQGIGGPQQTFMPRRFPYDGEDPLAWNKVDPPSPAGCRPYIVFTDGMEKISIRSDKACGCGWAVDWYPCGRDTCIVIWSEKSKHDERKGGLEGICGPMLTQADDWRTCHVDNAAPPSVPVPVGDFGTISDSCKHGKHDGQGYVGGTKMANFCGVPSPFPCQ